MNFAVVWKPAAEQELAALWVVSRRRDAVTAAIDALERRLAADPLAEGESRAGDDRVALEWPVGIDFRVDPVSRVVVVGRVWERR